MTTSDVYAEIKDERARAHAKHGAKSMESDEWNAERRLRILVEEVGEIARVLNDFDLGLIEEPLARVKLRAEALQTAAMATAWADGIEL